MNPLKFLSRGGAAAQESDADFENTVLLLHGDGNQGATNFSNTGPTKYMAFTDNSSNNFPITVNGDAYGDNFSPFSRDEGAWSNFFDGTGDYLSLANNAALQWGTGDFCVEAWVNPSDLSVIRDIVCKGTNNAGSFEIAIETSKVALYSTTRLFISTASISTNSWTHIAVTRSGTTVRCFINGALDTTITSSADFNNAGVFYVGVYGNASSNPFSGYISNVRCVKGSAVYTSAFTPPTAPLTAISGTSLLTCQSNRFKDNSSNNFAITRNGDVAVSPFTPFTVTPNTTDGSGYFDGTGDYIQVADNAALELASESNWTVEFWGCFVSTPSDFDVILGKGTASGNYEYFFEAFSDRTIDILYSGNGTTTWTGQHQLTPVLNLNEWFHFAAVRNGATFKSYVNGVEYFSGSSFNIYAGNGVLNIGGFSGSSTQDPNMYLSNVRIVKGTAVYTSNFTPPTTALPAITNTQLLTCQYQGTVRNVGFIDSSPYDHRITRVGNTTQGSFSPFSKPDGRWGNYFDGTGDYLSIADNAAFDFGTGDFTIEFWMRFAALPSSTSASMISTYSGGSDGYYIQYRTDLGGRNLRFGDSANVFIDDTSFNPNVNQWYHIAVARSGTALRMYIDGVVSSSTATNSTNFVSSVPFLIGHLAAGTQPFNGYISNVRVVKGTAVYTSNFTPSSSPLTNIANTSLLTCQSNRFKDNSTNNFTITRNGDVKVTPFSPFPITTAYDPAVNGGSGYFDGSGDSLLLPFGQPALLLGNSDFSFEAWVYRLNTTSSNVFSGQADNASAAGSSYVFYVNAGGTSDLYVGSSAYGITTPQPPVGAWSHVAFARTGGTFSSYLNGVRIGTRSDLSTLSVNNGTTNAPCIGAQAGGSSAVHFGYISGLRFIKGSGGFNATQSTITVPTAPPTVVSNTVLLTNFTNAGIFDNTGFNNLETVGNAQIDTSVKKYGTGAMKFDGTGDYLTAPDNANFSFGTGDFTVEAWIYLNAINRANGIWTNGPASTGAFGFYVTSGNKLEAAIYGGTNATGATSLAANTWYHVAVTRSGSTLRIFLNGTQDVSVTNANNNTTIKCTVGNSFTDQTASPNAMIDDLRITRGVARYTANFTPPTAALPDIGT